jgi:hypothetical protein
MTMFLQSFWFGVKLVGDGKIGACIDAMSLRYSGLVWSLQGTYRCAMCIPQFITLANHRVALLSLIQGLHHPSPPTPSSLTSPSTRSSIPIRRIIPHGKSCHSEFTIVVADLAANKPLLLASAVVAASNAKGVSRFVPTDVFTRSVAMERRRCPLSTY